MARAGATIRPVRTLTSRISVPLLLLATTCAIAFLVLAAVVSRQGSVGFDEPVIAFVTGLGVPTQAWRALTELGGLVLVPIGAGPRRMAAVVSAARWMRSWSPSP